MKRIFLLLFSLVALMAPASAQTQLTGSKLNALAKQASGSGVSIHDPSVVYRDGTFTVWGSHLGVATSKDLVNWTALRADGNTFVRLEKPGGASGKRCSHADAFNNQQVLTTIDCNGQPTELPAIDAENFCNWYDPDKTGHVNGNMWAPDIIYNEQMQKWCMYLSLNGDSWASVIILLTSDKATGPFTYQGPVVMSGFTGGAHKITGKETTIDAPSYTLTDLHLACGPLTALPARYKQKGSWGTYWPNCIDPCVFFDEEGQLWMIYGSWSGGIWLLRLDNETGLRDYTYAPKSNYELLKGSVTQDPYFGTRIAGGHYVSGEGSYIQHIGNYYYLFMSYGFFSPEGGYEMRIFRSEKPEGPYKDASGNLATYTSYQLNYGPKAQTNRGMLLMGAYNQWGGLQEVGERAQGHNSACTDAEGRSYVVYHTKFNDGTAGHQVRVHQLFLNEKDWLVAAPFCYRGETEHSVAPADIPGTYHVLLHPYKQDHDKYEEQTPREITLTPEGKVTGDYTGTWSAKEGSAQMTLKLGTTTYYGVFCLQHINGSTKQGYKTTELGAIAFTAMAQNGVPVWGYKLDEPSAVAWNYTQNTIAVKNGQTISGNVPLMFETSDNTQLTWVSSEPDVISATGRYCPQADVVPVTLTARLECGSHFWEETYNVKAQKETQPSGDWLTGLVGYYDFSTSPVTNQYKPATETDYERMTYNKVGSGTKPTLESDWEHSFIHLYTGTQGNNSFARTANPLLAREEMEGFSVSAWVRRTDDNLWDGIWSFFNVTNPANASPRLFLTGNAYVGFNDNADLWADMNKPKENGKGSGIIPVGEWTFVTVTVGPTSGVRVYVNGANKAAQSLASSTGSVTTQKALPAADIVRSVAEMKYFYLGMGSFNGSPDVRVADVLIHARELSTTDARSLYQMANRVYDFSIGEGGTSILAPWAPDVEAPARSGIFDLQGRRLNAVPQCGLYIRDGRLGVRIKD